MREVPLTNSCRVALVDDEDYERVAARKWRLQNGPYASSTNRPHVLMHRFILDAPPDRQVDHRNGDKLDNRRSNLRFCTQSENTANTMLSRQNKTGYKGVHPDRPGRWKAAIGYGPAWTHLGNYTTPEAAAHAYDNAARERYGEFARLNFPRDGEQPARRTPKEAA
jgi:hypothetical protein